MLENFSFRTIVEYLPLFGQGLVATVWLSLISFAGALAIGVIVCAMNLQPARFLRRRPRSTSTPCAPRLCWRSSIFSISVCRGWASSCRRCWSALSRLSLNSGAYIAEIIRAGILSISRGQVEAGVASGMTYLQRMRLIILPQAFKRDDPAAARASDRAGQGFRTAVLDLRR